LGGCVVQSAVNDYFLYLVSSAPKFNDELKELLIVVLTEWKKLEASGESKSFEGPLSLCLGHVVRCFRGLLALLSSDVGILGSQGSDVEAVSKMKRARTVKSGVAGNMHSCEAEICQLISANEWWGKAVDSYWKYAPMALALKPKLELAKQEASAEEHPELTTVAWACLSAKLLFLFSFGPMGPWGSRGASVVRFFCQIISSILPLANEL